MLHSMLVNLYKNKHGNTHLGASMSMSSESLNCGSNININAP